MYNENKINSNVNPKEGYLIYNLIKKKKFKKTLEIGFAFGISTIYILQALTENKKNNSDIFHIAIDPFQSSQWKNEGIKNVNKARLDEHFKLLQKKSHEALPYLLEKNKRFDMIFIDGMHLFDYTLVDIFYSDLLLNINGYLLIDDINIPGLKKLVNYLKTNYNHYQFKGTFYKRVALFKKIKTDNRRWDYHKDF